MTGHVKPVKWFYVPEWDTQFAAAPKAGSSSIRQAILNEDLNYVRSLPGAGRSIFIVRHPLARFLSLWKNSCRDGATLAITKGGERHNLKGLTPLQLMRYILNNENDHWATQTSLLGDTEAETVRIESMSRWWDEFPHSTQPYPRTNVSGGDNPDLGKRLLSVINSHYGEDLELWRRSKYATLSWNQTRSDTE
jgi:hypothetical protein